MVSRNAPMASVKTWSSMVARRLAPGSVLEDRQRRLLGAAEPGGLPGPLPRRLELALAVRSRNVRMHVAVAAHGSGVAEPCRGGVEGEQLVGLRLDLDFG